MPKCPKCGTTINEGQKFCTKCGAKIEEKEEINLSAEILAKIDIIQKKISNDNLNIALYVELGDVYFENEMFEEAILEYQKAFSIDNKNFDSIFKTAETYRKIKEFLKAESLYLNAIDVNPQSQEAKLGLFWSYHFQDKIMELISIEKEINDDVKTLDFHISLKKAYKKNNDNELAFNEMKIIHQLDSGNVENLKDLANHYSNEDNKKSIEFYNKILSINPNDIESIFVIGKDLCYKKNYKKTIELFESNLTNFQNDMLSIAHLYLSYSFVMLNNFDKAIEFISNINVSNIILKSEKNEEIFAKTLYSLSENCVKRNNFNSAINYLENAIKNEPKNKTFIDRLSSIKKLNASNQEKFKKNKSRKIKLSIITVIVISILIFALIKFLNIREEKIAWESALITNSVRSYQKYINDYPYGRYIDNAQIKKKEALVLKDSLAWINAKNINSIKSYEGYMINYPNGIYYSDAILAKEVSTWDSVKSTNLISFYEKYLSNYPKGKYKLQAIESIKNLNKKLLKTANLVFIQGGTFHMGSENAKQPDESPIHSVTVDDFFIGKYEITQKEWVEVMGYNPSNKKGDNLPVDMISQFDAAIFCNKKSEMDGLTPCYSSGGWYRICDFNANGYRLPTEAEWEYAARGGNKSKNFTYSGSNTASIVAWYYSNSSKYIHPVGSKKPNELGIYDMSGNVWEWCYDWYSANYYKDCLDQGTVSNPGGPNESNIKREVVLRGGSIISYTDYLRVSLRGNEHPSNTGKYVFLHPENYYGLRICRSSK